MCLLQIVLEIKIEGHFTMKILIYGFDSVWYIVTIDSFMLNWTEWKDTYTWANQGKEDGAKSDQRSRDSRTSCVRFRL